MYKHYGGYVRWCYVVDSEVVAEFRMAILHRKGEMACHWYGAKEHRQIVGKTFEESMKWLKRKIDYLAQRRGVSVLHDDRNPFVGDVDRWRAAL